MEIQLISDQNSWEKAFSLPLLDQPVEFLQSFVWGEFQQVVGNTPLRWQWIHEGKVVGQAQGFVHRLPFGLSYLYVPRMGQITLEQQKVLGEFLQKNFPFVFVRFESCASAFLTGIPSGAQPVKHRQPQHTLILDLRLSESELLAQFHSKTRYNIQLAHKKGVEVRRENNVEIFWQLNQETTARDGFKSHSKEYYAEMLKQDWVVQLVAYFDGQPIAANILIFSYNTATYLHGVSSNRSRNLMAPYLLQWEGIQLAKQKGCIFYDFWGVAPNCAQDSPGACTEFHTYRWQATHAFTGITRFKAGFAGEHRLAGAAFEIPLRLGLYSVYFWLKKIL